MNPQRPLKILFLASSYPRSNEDNASIFLRHLAESLSHRGIQVHVLAPSDGKSETIVKDDVTVHRFQYFPAPLQKLAYGSGIIPNLKRSPWLWIQVPFFLLSMAYALLRLVRNEKPALIHAHWILPQGLIGLLAKYVFETSLITTAHGADAFALRGRLTTRIKRFILARSDAWTANTPATASAIGALSLLPQSTVIPMGVNVDLFANGDPARVRAELPDNELLVLFVGRLVEKKGCHNLLSAFSLLTSDLRARTTLWIIGDGDHRSRLENQARSLTIIDKVRFWGAVSNHRLPEFYAAADLFVAPSIQSASGDTEGQGVVIIEAFAAKVCVLATKVGGISDVIADGITGMLVEPNNPRSLSRAIEKLLGDEVLRSRLATNARAKARNDYDLDKVAREFENLYRRVCRSCSTAS